MDNYLADILLTILFTTGLVILGFAIYFEAKEKAPIYAILSSLAGGLIIAATFIASLMH